MRVVGARDRVLVRPRRGRIGQRVLASGAAAGQGVGLGTRGRGRARRGEVGASPGLGAELGRERREDRLGVRAEHLEHGHQHGVAHGAGALVRHSERSRHGDARAAARLLLLLVERLGQQAEDAGRGLRRQREREGAQGGDGGAPRLQVVVEPAQRTDERQEHIESSPYGISREAASRPRRESFAGSMPPRMSRPRTAGAARLGRGIFGQARSRPTGPGAAPGARLRGAPAWHVEAHWREMSVDIGVDGRRDSAHDELMTPRSTAAARPLCLVTGGAAGLGFELARAFADAGCDLVLAGDGQVELDLAALELSALVPGVDIALEQADLMRASGPSLLHKRMRGLDTPVDILVANASIGAWGDLGGGSTLDDELATARVNTLSLLHLTRLVARDMAQRGQGQIFLASAESAAACCFDSLQHATRAFASALATGLAHELEESGVRVEGLSAEVDREGAVARLHDPAALVEVARAATERARRQRAAAESLEAVLHEATLGATGAFAWPLAATARA
ncbi:MAG: SDR family NAD(P)-dependent oxidoreductase [Myxococcota bacterium]